MTDSKFHGKILYAVIALVVAVAAVTAVYLQLTKTYGAALSMSVAAPTTIYPYQTAAFTINVTNTGSAPLNGLPVVLYQNNTPLRTYTVSVQPHGSAQITLNYTFVDPGLHRFSAVADPSMLLKLDNRARASATLVRNVTAAQSPDVYNSVPNANISYTQSFSGTGSMYYASLFTQYYNISFLNHVFGDRSGFYPVLINDLSKQITEVNGAYTIYSSGSIVYVLWLQGTLTPQSVDSIIATFDAKSARIFGGAANVSLYALDNRTSVCVFYEKGWTKIISYRNTSADRQTCANLINDYNATQRTAILAALKADPGIVKAQSSLIYTNSTNIVFAVELAARRLALTNIFLNGYGLFAARVVENAHTANTISSNYTCNGLVSKQNGASVCSVYLIPDSNKTTVALVNSTAITANYTISLYSLVNQSAAVAAHYAASALIGSLNLSSTAQWSSSFVNKCSFANTHLGCTVSSFDYTSQYAQLDITNNFNSTLTITGAACHAYTGNAILPTALTVMPGNTAGLQVACIALALPVVSLQRSYSLNLNFTVNNIKYSANGTLVVTNFQ